MTALPTADRLAALVSHVTETMVGVSFHPDVAASAAPPLTWRTAVLAIAGKRPLTRAERIYGEDEKSKLYQS